MLKLPKKYWAPATVKLTSQSFMSCDTQGRVLEYSRIAAYYRIQTLLLDIVELSAQTRLIFI